MDVNSSFCRERRALFNVYSWFQVRQLYERIKHSGTVGTIFGNMPIYVNSGITFYTTRVTKKINTPLERALNFGPRSASFAYSY